MLKAGSPGDMSTSTSMIAPSNPKIAQLLTLVSILESPLLIGQSSSIFHDNSRARFLLGNFCPVRTHSRHYRLYLNTIVPKRGLNLAIGEHYQEAFSAILSKLNVRPLSAAPNFEISPQSTVSEAIQYTDWYCYRGDSQGHYRFRRYFDALCNLGPAGNRLAHIDIGCGSGCFSWAFLDWAEAWCLNYGQVKLFGIDRCPAMIQAAEMIRSEMIVSLPNYPTLHYHLDVRSLMTDFQENHHLHADSVITMGHVLAQSHCPTDIQNFTDIIWAVRRQTDPSRRCVLVTVDALGHAADFEMGWNTLLQHLQEYSITPTVINSHNSVRLASLCTGIG